MSNGDFAETQKKAQPSPKVEPSEIKPKDWNTNFKILKKSKKLRRRRFLRPHSQLPNKPADYIPQLGHPHQ